MQKSEITGHPYNFEFGNYLKSITLSDKFLSSSLYEWLLTRL